ncbi:unnamed protein product [Oikopleura dioica]|uniref:Uncharacterized protein n=1 Tax=Oikopleura dioica TaxID=34765 RepID=E4Z0B4_OIKDI|nr:unnamed protein product [Oikopleura dioica]
MDALRNLFLNKNPNDNTTSWDPSPHRDSTNRPDQNFSSFSESKTYEQDGMTVTETTWTNENGKVTETRKTYNLDPENSSQGNLDGRPHINDLILGGHSLMGMLGRAEDDFDKLFGQMENEMNHVMSSTMPIFLEFGNRAHDLHSNLIEREMRRMNPDLESPRVGDNSVRDHFVTSAIPCRNIEAPVEVPLFNPQFTVPDFAKEFKESISKFS